MGCCWSGWGNWRHRTGKLDMGQNQIDPDQIGPDQINHIHVVGIGLDGAAGLAGPLRLLVEQADWLVGSDRHLAYFPDLSVQRLVLGDLHGAIAQLQRFCQPAPSEPRATKTRKTAVILTSGDPLFFGLGRLLLEQLPPTQLSFHPHPSAVQLAFSRLKLPWQDAALVSVHGREMDQLIVLLQRGHGKIAVLTDPIQSPAAIAA